MFTDFSIKNFRCFGDLTIKPLGRVNLFAGKNNVGKTALLEAIFLFYGHGNPELGIRIDSIRGYNRIKLDEIMLNLFRNFEQKKPIQMSCRTSEDESSSLSISVSERPTTRLDFNDSSSSSAEDINDRRETKVASDETTGKIQSEILFNYSNSLGESISTRAYVENEQVLFDRKTGITKPIGIFLFGEQYKNQQVLSERLSNLSLDKKQIDVIEMLKIIEPDIKDLSIQFIGGATFIFGDLGGQKLVPLPLMGDGIGRLLSIALAIPFAKNGILLIDEIENGFHWTVMSKVWKAIAKFADSYNVQIFATTHSWECIDSFHEALSDLVDDNITGMLFRLDKTQEEIKPVSYNLADLAVVVEQKIEVR